MQGKKYEFLVFMSAANLHKQRITSIIRFPRCNKMFDLIGITIHDTTKVFTTLL